MLTRRQIDQVAKQIAAEFRPERIILFGSHANGTATADSDVDLLVVKRMRGDVVKKAAEIYSFIHTMTKSAFSVDVLVRTPAEMRHRIALNDFFLRDIVENGKVLYESNLGRVGVESRSGPRRRVTRTSRSEVAKL